MRRGPSGHRRRRRPGLARIGARRADRRLDGLGDPACRSDAAPARDAIDWRRLDMWWGDERFLPGGDAERNETQARAALLDAVPLDPARVHPMPALGRARRRRRRTPRGPLRPSWPPRPAGVKDVPRSTCCCWGWGRTRTSPRCSPSTRRCTSAGDTVGRARLPQAAAHPDLADLARPRARPGHLVPRVRGGQGGRHRPGRSSGLGRCRPPRPVCATARCGCWTRRRPPCRGAIRPAAAASPSRPTVHIAPVRQRSRSSDASPSRGPGRLCGLAVSAAPAHRA